MAWYMVHKHHATRAGLHWDLRLEQNGVLKSWAIPKGMPTKSGVRHLAIQTPDHDLAYGKWEGTIPEGSYGAGKVTIDTTGEYQTIEQTKKKWKFQCLTGKYKGTWTLIHWKNKQWLITKSADQKSAEEDYPKHEAFLEELKKDYDYTSVKAFSMDGIGHQFGSKDGVKVLFIQLQDMDLDIFQEPQKTYLIFDWLESKNKRQGNATEMMYAIIKAADKTGTTLHLDCGYHDVSEHPDDIPLNKLCEWYETYGFMRGGYPRIMMRKPEREDWSPIEVRWAEAPLEGQTFAAPYEIKIYVPSTRLDTKISEAAFQNRIRVTKSFLSHLFGGYTSVEGQGGYISNDGGLITEPVVVVTGFANPKDYEEKLYLLESFIKSKQKRWGQESLGFEFENDFFMYPDF